MNYNSNKHGEEISCDKASQFKTSENLNKNHEKFLVHDEKVRTLAVSIYKIPIILLANQNQSSRRKSIKQNQRDTFEIQHLLQGVLNTLQTNNLLSNLVVNL